MRIGAPLDQEAIPGLQWIEVSTTLQIPSFQIIGLPAPEVAEARERVRAAMEAGGLEFPRRRVVVNLAPASVRKRGTGLDLPMALAILIDRDGKVASRDQTLVAWAELGLDGQVKSASQATRAVYAAWRAGASVVLLAREDLPLAKEVIRWMSESGELDGPPPRAIGISSLQEAWRIIREGLDAELGESLALPFQHDHVPQTQLLMPISPALERALGISAAGGHHLFLLGPRGTGKSHALEWLIALQPPVSGSVRLRQRLLAELSWSSKESTDFPRSASIRRVGANVRPGALLGGATTSGVRPGEYTLAHGGMLVADEFPEWPRDARETLREPLERGAITLTRAGASIELPAVFTLAANGNLCPCGGWPEGFPFPLERGDEATSLPRCRCTESARSQYLARLSGPVLDRLDMILLVGASFALPKKEEVQEREEHVCRLREKVARARDHSRALWGGPPGKLPPAEIELLIRSHPEWVSTLSRMTFASLRARHKVARVALSLTAWDGGDSPKPSHFAEAACYRPERFGFCA